MLCFSMGRACRKGKAYRKGIGYGVANAVGKANPIVRPKAVVREQAMIKAKAILYGEGFLFRSLFFLAIHSHCTSVWLRVALRWVPQFFQVLYFEICMAMGLLWVVLFRRLHETCPFYMRYGIALDL